MAYTTQRESYRTEKEAEESRDRWLKRGCPADIEPHPPLKWVVVIVRKDMPRRR